VGQTTFENAPTFSREKQVYQSIKERFEQRVLTNLWRATPLRTKNSSKSASTMVGQKKKQLVVVKNLRDLSPKRQLLMTRVTTDIENEQLPLQQSAIGNHSPSVRTFETSWSKHGYLLISLHT
jgi:hypothetical protein